MLKAVCKNNREHKKFHTVAHVTETWLVTENGDFLDHYCDGEVTHGPDKDNIWTCVECGEEAIVEEV